MEINVENTYKRWIEPEILELMEQPEIIVLTGMRRVGKTTLMHRVKERINSENTAYFDLENVLDRELFQQDDYEQVHRDLVIEGDLTEKDRPYVFLDEIQLLPGITSVLKYLHDHTNIKFMVTGSSSFYMENLFPESLAGRKFLLELHGLTFEEFLLFKGEKKGFSESPLAERAQEKSEHRTKKYAPLYREYQRFGGFPEVVLSESKELKKKRLKDIFSSYFQMDVQRLGDFRKTDVFRDLCRLIMRRTGQKLNVQKLSSELEVTRKTLYSYLEFLERSYFLRRIQPYSQSPDREVSGQPKLYLADTGFVCQLGEQGPGGSVLENAVFNQLRYRTDRVNYYQRRGGSEVDFILDKNVGIEVKETAREQDIRTLKRLGRDLQLDEAYVVTENYRESPEVLVASDL